MPIDGRKKHGDIVSELIKEYKKTGKIGDSEPKDMDAALKQANAIAYNKKGTAKTEAIDDKNDIFDRLQLDDIVLYKDKYGDTVKGKVVDKYTSTLNNKIVDINSTMNSIPAKNIIKIINSKSTTVEALENHIQALVRPENKAFLEGIVMKGFKTCFENALNTLDDTPVRLMGRTFYYDSSEGKYYEPEKDKYLEYDEYESLKQADDKAQADYVSRINAGIEKASSAKELHNLINAKNLYWDQDKAREAEARAMQITGDMPMMEADDLESDDIVRMDTDSLTSDEVEVVQTQLDEIKQDKEEIEARQEEISEKEEELVNTSAALSLNESKSEEASAVLQLMDKDYSYQDALKKVMKDNSDLNKSKLENELDTYI